ncbi:MAG TPA: diversity-generating retroelement protein Avd [Candidatus Paceibacterota bacterium]|nr:diversity-generating retroelement protein Avd [Candidatus Paceibacterota bacterium]HPP65022.1 diversity-generating retroelement protein Avd [Candidatus Paceibacterota bacterium]
MVNEPPIFHKTYELILWFWPIANKFPKSQRFVLGQRIENTLLDFLELIIEAKNSKIKISALAKASIKLDKLRIIIRLAKDLKFISIKQYQFAAITVDEIGKMLGGWLKSLSLKNEEAGF